MKNAWCEYCIALIKPRMDRGILKLSWTVLNHSKSLALSDVVHLQVMLCKFMVGIPATIVPFHGTSMPLTGGPNGTLAKLQRVQRSSQPQSHPRAHTFDDTGRSVDFIILHLDSRNDLRY